jgi:Lon protease-like protein
MRTPFSESRLQRVPLFVLPGVHLFPGTLLPLHIFEPRYVAMLEYVLTEGSRALVMATIDDSRALPGHHAPPVHGVMGLGRVMAAKPTDAGRWDIVVQGVDRVQLIEEHTLTAPYRQAAVARLDDVDVAPGHPLHGRLRQLVGLLAVAAPSARTSLELLLKQGRTPAALTDLLAAHAVAEAHAQRRLLEMRDVAERLSVCCELMGRLLLEADQASPLLH